MIEYFNLFIDQNLIYSFCLKTNKYANQNGVAGFEDVALVKMISFVAMNIVMAIVNISDVSQTFGLKTKFFHILGSLQ